MSSLRERNPEKNPGNVSGHEMVPEFPCQDPRLSRVTVILFSAQGMPVLNPRFSTGIHDISTVMTNLRILLVNPAPQRTKIGASYSITAKRGLALNLMGVTRSGSAA
jgi:hypothetical protein